MRRRYTIGAYTPRCSKRLEFDFRFSGEAESGTRHDWRRRTLPVYQMVENRNARLPMGVVFRFSTTHETWSLDDEPQALPLLSPTTVESGSWRTIRAMHPDVAHRSGR
jgi:hypothetical protein